MEGMTGDMIAQAAAAEGMADDNHSLALIRGTAEQLQVHITGQQQGGEDSDAATAYSLHAVRRKCHLPRLVRQRALDIIPCNGVDGIPAAGQPAGSTLSVSAGDGQSKRRKSEPRWSTQVRLRDAQDTTFLHDGGHSWRKYGQKHVLGAKHPRSYYRCTNRNMLGCPATKTVQRTDDDPLLVDVVYHGTHTCSAKAPGAAAHPNNQGMLPAAAIVEHSHVALFNQPNQAGVFPSHNNQQTVTTSQNQARSNEHGLAHQLLPATSCSGVLGSMGWTKGDMGHETLLSETMAEELHSSLCKDVMRWFAMGKQRQIGRPSHTCMQKTGQELLGRDDIRQMIMEKILLDSNAINNCSVICIYGSSGLGKTSLLHVLYNDHKLLDAFDKRIWIQISGKIDILMLFRKIIEFAMNEHCSITNIAMLRELVVEEIGDKKFILFLDDADIENRQFWTTALEVLNTGAKGSVVVMATRTSTVAADRNVTIDSYSLNPLYAGNSLMLHQLHAVVGTNTQSIPDLVVIANRIISRFGSNLLYLKAIAGLLCHTDNFSIEKDKFEGSAMPLQLCHDVLPIHLKRCLALCSLFPEGYIFDKHHMVLLSISHGCVRPMEGREPEDVGTEYLNELFCRSFFQCSPAHSDKDDMFVMHELMYKVVESVSGDEYFKYEDPMSSIPENVLHLSLVSLQFQTVELMHRTEKLKDLQTFLVVQPEWTLNRTSFPTLNLVGLDEFFLKFTSLETLDLSHTETKELPGSIVGLRNLQYLSVNNTNIRVLPSEICSLSNLQTLEAKHCRFLTELPRDIKKLVKLRHLDLMKELGHVHLPHGIGELTELQKLSVFHSSGDSSHCSVTELGSLQHLRGCLWLSGLESVKTGSKAQEANLKDKQHLRDLTLQWYDDGIDIEDKDAENVTDEQVLESLQPHANLQVLTIRGYEGTTFPAWMQESSSLPNLVTLTLDSCCNCTQFPAIAQLPSLKSLSVRKTYDVQCLSSNTHGAAKFPSLELLNLWEMYGLEELFEESEGDCPRLRKVCVSRCPDLKMLPHAPSLTELVLHCCHQLPDISGLASLVSLKIEGFHGIKSLSLPAGAALKKLEIRSCKELSSVDGLSALTTVQRLKIAGCPKLVLPGTG